MITKKRLFFLLIAGFLLRLCFGLFQGKWGEEDEFQTYLIGLKCFTTGTWPYFGPDLTGAETHFSGQIAGALEGLLIGLPFHLLPIPEAPYILLGILSTAGIAILTWYIVKRQPQLSYTWLFIWIAFCPWTMNEATHIINPSYVFFPSILFFIGFLESLSFLTMGLIPIWLSNALMGFSIGWTMQFHTSYIYLVPLAFFSIIWQLKDKKISAPLYFVLGAMPMLALIIPTYLKFGFDSGANAAGFAVPFDWDNAKEFFTILARYLSLVCLEMPRFVDTSTKTRIAFLMVHWWLFLPGLILCVIGWVQPFVLLVEGFRNKSSRLDWKPLKLLVLAGFLMVYISFLFTVKKPLAHIYFIFFPLLMIYSCDCWSIYLSRPVFKILTKIGLVLCVYFQMGYALAVMDKSSLYPQRDLILKAIQEKNYRLLGERYNKRY